MEYNHALAPRFDQRVHPEVRKERGVHHVDIRVEAEPGRTISTMSLLRHVDSHSGKLSSRTAIREETALTIFGPWRV